MRSILSIIRVILLPSSFFSSFQIRNYIIHKSNKYIYMYIYNCSLPIIRLKKIFKEENIYSLGFETVYISFLFIIMICNGISYLDAFIIRCLHWSTDAIWINTYRTLTTILLYLCDIIIIYLAQPHNFYIYPFLNISIRSREM